MRVGLAYDLQTHSTDQRQAEFDPPDRLEAIRAGLEALGHVVVPLGNAHDLARRLGRRLDVDLVLNLCEGAGGRCREAWAPTLLELSHIPYIGSGPTALALGLDKLSCKRLALASGVSTPPWIVVDDPARLRHSGHPALAGWGSGRDVALEGRTVGTTPPWRGGAPLPDQLPFPFPAIVKPRYEGSGIGIDDGAVVRDHHALAERIRWLSRRWPEPILVEQFIPYGELTVCLIGNGPAVAYPAIQRPLDPISRLSCHVAGSHAPRQASGPVAWEAPLHLTDTIDAQARRLAQVMFEVIGCRDMARVDFRVDEQGRIWFLEINPLPSLDPEGSFGLLAEYLGSSYAQILDRMLQAAQARLSVEPRMAHGAAHPLLADPAIWPRLPAAPAGQAGPPQPASHESRGGLAPGPSAVLKRTEGRPACRAGRGAGRDVAPHEASSRVPPRLGGVGLHCSSDSRS